MKSKPFISDDGADYKKLMTSQVSEDLTNVITLQYKKFQNVFGDVNSKEFKAQISDAFDYMLENLDTELLTKFRKVRKNMNYGMYPNK